MEDILGIKEEKEMTVKEQREINLIVENLELIKVIMKVFQGQVLYMDLQEFCLRFKVFDTGEAFGYAVEKLIKGKVLKKTIYPNTNYIVLIAKTCVNRYMNNVYDTLNNLIDDKYEEKINFYNGITGNWRGRKELRNFAFKY